MPSLQLLFKKKTYLQQKKGFKLNVYIKSRFQHYEVLYNASSLDVYNYSAKSCLRLMTW